MKRVVFVLTGFLLILSIRAQVVFSPAGAEWRYAFWGPFTKSMDGETIRYARDSTIGNEPCKVLTHLRFYLKCNDSLVTLTLIKQRGDTVFFRNIKTQHTWQILYNYAASTGQGWQTSVLDYASVPVTYSYTVDSVGYSMMHGVFIKRLVVNGNLAISERMGSNNFLFNYLNNKPGCIGDNFLKYMCYRDDSFSMNYMPLGCGANLMGTDDLNKGSNVLLYPNPVNETLYIESGLMEEDVALVLYNSVGQEVMRSENIHQDPKIKTQGSQIQIDVKQLPAGVYLLELSGNRLQRAIKVVKEPGK